MNKEKETNDGSPKNQDREKAYFVLVSKQLKSFSQAWFRSMPLCQGTHDLRMIDDESRIHTGLFQEVPHKLQMTRMK